MPKAAAEEIRPIETPSIIKGMRTKASVAPTAFIMLISSLRLYIVTRIVLETITKDIITSKPITISPAVFAASLMLVTFSATSF